MRKIIILCCCIYGSPVYCLSNFRKSGGEAIQTVMQYLDPKKVNVSLLSYKEFVIWRKKVEEALAKVPAQLRNKVDVLVREQINKIIENNKELLIDFGSEIVQNFDKPFVRTQFKINNEQLENAVKILAEENLGTAAITILEGIVHTAESKLYELEQTKNKINIPAVQQSLKLFEKLKAELETRNVPIAALESALKGLKIHLDRLVNSEPKNKTGAQIAKLHSKKPLQESRQKTIIS